MCSKTGVWSQRSAVPRPVFHFRSTSRGGDLRKEDVQVMPLTQARQGLGSTEISLISANQRGSQYGN